MQSLKRRIRLSHGAIIGAFAIIAGGVLFMRGQAAADERSIPELGPSTLVGEVRPNLDELQEGSCLFDGGGRRGRRPDIHAYGYCLAMCRGMDDYYYVSQDHYEFGDNSAESDCERDAEFWCEQNFNRRLDASCLGK
ncbi:hypothetical protein [Nannocystis bainbridge]|uniref:Uncharacterized protein n=1 Tax=Nannocystis bainbridge TaxID=2995303 RepID=A0ABT5E8Q1_9BACT|nr:hypothetical protein [Nannocystis bainbridge]MDC0721790.1 hypothetical protein [Nannocystis bainbridge]